MTLLQQALGAIVRWLLAFAAGYLVDHGIWSRSDADGYISALATAITMGAISLGWSLWQKYKSRIHFLTALEMPAGTPEQKVSERVSRGEGVLPIVVLCAIALGASSCASMASARHRSALTVGSTHAVLTTLREGELLLVCGRPTAPASPNCVAPEAHRAISAKLVTAFDLDGKVAQLARDLPADASPSSYAGLLGQIGRLVDDALALIPDSSNKQSLLTKVGLR